MSNQCLLQWHTTCVSYLVCVTVTQAVFPKKCGKCCKYRIWNIQNFGNIVVHVNFLHDQKLCYNYTRPRSMRDHACVSPWLFGRIGQPSSALFRVNHCNTCKLNLASLFDSEFINGKADDSFWWRNRTACIKVKIGLTRVIRIKTLVRSEIFEEAWKEKVPLPWLHGVDLPDRVRGTLPSTWLEYKVDDGMNL